MARLGSSAWRLLTDVRFAVVLIVLLALAGLVATLVRQFPVSAGGDPAPVRRRAGGHAPGLGRHRCRSGCRWARRSWTSFDAVGLFSVFSAPWFLLLMAVLTLSIVCCTLDRTPRLWRGASTVRIEQPEAFFDTRARPAGDRAAGAPGRMRRPSTVAAVAACLPARHFRRQRVVRAEGATWIYGDRNQYQQLATLLTHAGLVLFLLAGAVTVAASFEAVLFVGEGQTAPVRSVGTPDNLLLKVHDFAAPQRADGSFADYSTDVSVYQDGSRGGPQDDPRQRPADGRRLHHPPEHVRSGCPAGHPRRGRQPRLGRAAPPRSPAGGPPGGLPDGARRGAGPGGRAQRGSRRRRRSSSCRASGRPTRSPARARPCSS